MTEDAATSLAKKVLQDAEHQLPKGNRPFPFIIKKEGGPLGGNAPLSEIYKRQMGDVLEMEAARRGDRLVQKQIEAMEKTAEADSLKAQMELERLKRGEGPGGNGGPINQIRDTLQAMTALEQFKGPNQQTDFLKALMETQRQSSETAWKMMVEMERQRGDLMGQMGTLREQSVKGQMEGIVKALEARMEMLSKEADWGAKMREFQKMSEMMGRGPGDAVQEKALKTLEMEVDLKKKQMDMEQKRWEADKASTNEILKTTIGVLGAAAAPIIAKLADRAMTGIAPAALGAGAQPGVQAAAPPAAPKVYQFPKPDTETFQLECGNPACKNHFPCHLGSDAYICPSCGSVHRIA